ncbi:hypothetical protein GCM10010294_67670 [Streptomyces griseoloalbus]|uniref:HK97-gp10 family putative phage morphogenesis protein n=1 Tax=Streptomyces griseoloalbus TaxID=67303 RepID=UPI00187568A8|nr:hypothetical protein GCM10010294_67670 [Streptomyces griseoloalbus]
MARRRRRRSPVRMQVHGMDSLRESLEGLAPKLLEASRAAVEASAEAVQEQTRDSVRVDTGNLRDSVGIHYARGGLAAKVGWKDRADWYATIHEFGSQRIPAQPALGPALEQERVRFEDRLKIEVRRVLS